VVSAAADRNLIEALHRTARSRGWQVERVVPAQAAWLQALQETIPLPTADRPVDGLQSKRLVIAVAGEIATLLRLVGRQPDLLRRTVDPDPAGMMEEAGEGPGQALVLAPGERRERLLSALSEAGWDAIAFEDSRAAGLEAARHAAAALPELVSPTQARARGMRERRRTRNMLAAAVLLLVAAAPVHLWGLNRELRAVRSERTALRQLFAPALARRDSLDRMLERIESMQALEQTGSGWTAFLVELSLLLPRDTYLVSLRGEGDRVVVEAAGERAGEALSALRRATTFRDVRLEGLIQRDIEEGETSREHFSLSLVLVDGGDR
jgi:hypothetical protein